MKKRILIISLIVATIFSLSAAAKNKLVKVTGVINQFGSEPFTTIGIVTDDNKNYSIKIDKEDESKLKEVAGKKVEIKGYIYLPEEGILDLASLSDGILEVEKWKVLKK